MSGVESITLLQSEMPFHTHVLRGDEDQAQFLTPTNMLLADGNAMYLGNNPQGNAILAPQALALAGGGLPHNNLQPYLTLNFCIALQGIFPQRP
jgi:microcystin-dependent protein